MQHILPSQEHRNIIHDYLIFGGMNIHNFKGVNCILQTSSNCSFLITDIFCLIKMKYQDKCLQLVPYPGSHSLALSLSHSYCFPLNNKLECRGNI